MMYAFGGDYTPVGIEDTIKRSGEKDGCNHSVTNRVTLKRVRKHSKHCRPGLIRYCCYRGRAVRLLRVRRRRMNRRRLQGTACANRRTDPGKKSWSRRRAAHWHWYECIRIGRNRSPIVFQPMTGVNLDRTISSGVIDVDDHDFYLRPTRAPNKADSNKSVRTDRVAERAKSKIGRWVDETMKGKFDNFVGSRKKSTSNNTSSKTNNEIPVLPDADENIDADLLHSVKPAELHSRITESVYEDESTRPQIALTGVDLGILFSNVTRKQHLEEVNADERDVGMMIQQHLKLLNIVSENATTEEGYRNSA